MLKSGKTSRSSNSKSIFQYLSDCSWARKMLLSGLLSILVKSCACHILIYETRGTLPGAPPFLWMFELIAFDQFYSNRSQTFRVVFAGSTKCNWNQNSELHLVKVQNVTETKDSELSLLEVLNVTETKIQSYAKRKY